MTSVAVIWTNEAACHSLHCEVLTGWVVLVISDISINGLKVLLTIRPEHLPVFFRAKIRVLWILFGLSVKVSIKWIAKSCSIGTNPKRMYCFGWLGNILIDYYGEWLGDQAATSLCSPWLVIIARHCALETAQVRDMHMQHCDCLVFLNIRSAFICYIRTHVHVYLLIKWVIDCCVHLLIVKDSEWDHSMTPPHDFIGPPMLWSHSLSFTMHTYFMC